MPCSRAAVIAMHIAVLRMIATSLGRADMVTTQRHYLENGKAHLEAADLSDRAMRPAAN